MNRREFFKFTGAVAVGTVIPVKALQQGLEAAVEEVWQAAISAPMIAMEMGPAGDRLVEVAMKYSKADEHFVVTAVRALTAEEILQVQAEHPYVRGFYA